MENSDLFAALSNPRRLQILAWLKSPSDHFPPQRDGDLIEDGVCGQSLADKLNINASTLSEHMRILLECELVCARRIKQWTFYKRNEQGFQNLACIIPEI